MQHANKTRGVGPLGGSGVVGLWSASSLIKSIQYGITVANTAASATLTINAVDTANSCAVFLGCSSDATTAAGHWAGYCQLTNATTVTTTYQAATNSRVATICVIEFRPGVLKSKQTVSISVVSAASNTASITEVNTAKSLIVSGGQSMYQGDQNEPGRLSFSSATAVLVTRGGSTAWTTVTTATVLEFF